MPLLGKGALTVWALLLAASGLWVWQASTGLFFFSLFYLAPLVIAGHLILLTWTLWKIAERRISQRS